MGCPHVAIVTASDLASCPDVWSAHVGRQTCKPWCSGPRPRGARPLRRRHWLDGGAMADEESVLIDFKDMADIVAIRREDQHAVVQSGSSSAPEDALRAED